MDALKRIFFHSPIRYIVAALIACAVTLVVLIRSDFTRLFNYVNALTTGGGVCIFFGLLVLVTYFGAFDIFGYAFKTPSKRKRLPYYDYTRAKKQKRPKLSFVPYITVGTLFIIAGLIVRLWV